MTTDTRNLRLFLEGRFVDRLNVVSFRGVEEANRLYRIDVDFTTDAIDDHLEEHLLDRGAMLSVQGSGEVVRALYGIALPSRRTACTRGTCAPTASRSCPAWRASSCGARAASGWT
jgi:hypothetical protein